MSEHIGPHRASSTARRSLRLGQSHTWRTINVLVCDHFAASLVCNLDQTELTQRRYSSLQCTPSGRRYARERALLPTFGWERESLVPWPVSSEPLSRSLDRQDSGASQVLKSGPWEADGRHRSIFCRSRPDGLHHTGDGNTMPQSSHDQAAELHNLASHTHAVAADAHGKADHLTDHELSKQADELSRNALKHAGQLDTPAAESATVETGKDEK